MLQYNPDWDYQSPGPIPDPVRFGFLEIINRIAGRGPAKDVYEHFKGHFASAAGTSAVSSSSESWAAYDLENYMRDASSNAPLFIDAFVTAWTKLQDWNVRLPPPNIDHLNKLLADTDAGYQIQDSHIVATRAHEPVAVPERPASLDEHAQELIQKSLAASKRLLSEGNGRQAVQELLWLLETITTAFKGTAKAEGSVSGKYFTTIIKEMRADKRGTHQDRIVEWIERLHGFLSAPAGGGVRHGQDLAQGVAMNFNEASLYCNLIRSYITYLLEEHQAPQ
jgi:hypothetical protein